PHLPASPLPLPEERFVGGLVLCLCWSVVTRHSSLLLQPLFTAALKNENIFELRLVAQPFRNVTACITTLGAAINDNFLPSRRVGQKLPQQFVPAIFVQ